MIALAKFCPYCGSDNEPEKLYCRNCPNSIVDVEPTSRDRRPQPLEASAAPAPKTLQERAATTGVACPQCKLWNDGILDFCSECDTQLYDADLVANKPEPAAVEVYAGATFRGYRVVENLRVTSAEADLWRVEAAGGGTFLLKLYRFGIEPKREVIEALQRLRREHVVDVIETGIADGRHFEIQEFISHGSLADYATGRTLTDCNAKAVLRELATALAHLHEAGIRHRDLKPSNVLVRTKEPLDLVLTDFGIASLTELSIHVSTITGGTAAYSAPETLSGVVTATSDWWALGMIMLEMLTGQNYFDGCNEIEINFQLTQSIAIPRTLDSDWQLLLRGLLTRNHEKRWRATEVTAWIDGRRDIPAHFESGEIADEAECNPYRRWQKHKIFDPVELASVLAADWQKGRGHFEQFQHQIHDWIKHDVGDDDRAAHFGELLADKNLEGEHRFAVALMLLHPALPLHVGGELVTPAWLAAPAPGESAAPRDEAVSLLESSVPEWLEKLRGEPWLVSIRRDRQQHRVELQQCSLALDGRRVEWLLLCDPSDVVAWAVKQRAEYVHAVDPRLDTLLRKPSLTAVEAIILAASPRTAFLTADEHSVTRLNQQAREIVDYLNWRRISRSLRLGAGWLIPNPALATIAAVLAAIACAIPLRGVWATTPVLMTSLLVAISVAAALLVFRHTALRNMQRFAAQTGGKFAKNTTSQEAAAIADNVGMLLPNFGPEAANASELELTRKLDEIVGKVEKITPSAGGHPLRLLPDVPLQATLGAWAVVGAALASGLVFRALTPTQLIARPSDRKDAIPVAAASPAPTSSVAPGGTLAGATPFRGSVSSIDQKMNTLTVADDSSYRVLHVGSETTLIRNGASVGLTDIRQNEVVTGSYRKRNDGTLVAKTVNLPGVAGSSTPQYANSSTPAAVKPSSSAIPLHPGLRYDEQGQLKADLPSRFKPRSYYEQAAKEEKERQARDADLKRPAEEAQIQKQISTPQLATSSTSLSDPQSSLPPATGALSAVEYSASTTPTEVPTAAARSNAPATTVRLAVSGTLPGERFPETRTRRLVREDVQMWSDAKLQYAINEMFARHGAEFGNPAAARWFAQFSWYAPRAGSNFDDIENSLMSETERQNLLLLGGFRDARREAAKTQQAADRGTRRDRPNQQVQKRDPKPDPVAEEFLRLLLRGVAEGINRRR
jgi:hypothetical protein